MLAVVIVVLDMEATWVNLGVILFIKGKVLDRFHDLILTEMNECLNIVHETLMLDRSVFAYVLLNLDRVLA